MARKEWTGVYCVGERHQTACLSWFKPFVPASWGLPIAADIQEDVDTGRETAIRALFRLSDGTLKEAIRRKSGGKITVITRGASQAICNTPSARFAITKAREGASE